MACEISMLHNRIYRPENINGDSDNKLHIENDPYGTN